MSDPRYAHVGRPETRVIEECAELIHACGSLIQILCKVDRFGWFNHHPDRPEITNMEEVKREMHDVVEACERLEVSMRQVKYEHNQAINPTPATQSEVLRKSE